MLTNLILLDAAPAAAPNDGAGLMNILMIVALVVVFWLFMIRPQQKKQKEIKRFREGITAGDRVVTAGGIHGKVKKVEDTTFQVEISNGVTITIEKSSVYPSAADAQTAQPTDPSAGK